MWLLNTAFFLEAALFTGVFLFISVSSVSYHLVHCISISPLHLLVSQGAVKDLSEGCAIKFHKLLHVSFFCLRQLSYNTEDDVKLS